MSNAKDLLLTAKGNDELTDCLMGNGAYNTSNRFEPNQVNENRILVGVQDASAVDKDIIESFEKALSKMLGSGVETYFIAFRYLVFYADLKSKNKIEYTLNVQTLSKKASDFFSVYEVQLKQLESVPQVSFKGNAYKRLIELDLISKKEYGIPILNEKNFVSCSQIYSHINQNVLQGAKAAHRVSQPVIYQEDGKHYLAVFVFFYTREDIEGGAVDRPTMWAIADIETGEIISEYNTKEKEFSDASYNKKYNIRSDTKFDTSKKYYDKAFAILDSVREKLIFSGQLYRDEYKLYLDMILANIPHDYQRFFKDLSV